MSETTSKQAPADLQHLVGGKVRLQCNEDTECPSAEHQPDSVLQGWVAFFKGFPQTTTDSQIDPKLYARGWQAAKDYKAHRESLTWTLSAVEETEDGPVAVLTREEVNSYNDVMNGSGTGLGTHTVTERVRLNN